MDKNYILFDDDDAISIAKIIREFEDEHINYIEMEKQLKQLNFSMIPSLKDSSKFKLRKQVEDFKTRIQTKTLLPEDVNGFFISNEKYDNLLFRYDRYIIELLANHGDAKAIEELNRLREWEANFPNWQVERDREFAEFAIKSRRLH